MMDRFCYDVRQAIQNLQAFKLRSCLAILGILVGTASIVALMSCSRLATEKAIAQFRALGTHMVAVTLFQGSGGHGQSSDVDVPVRFWRMMPEVMPKIASIAPYSTVYDNMTFHGRALNGVIVGADESLADLIHIEMVGGRFVSSLETTEHHCVIGQTILQQLRAEQLVDPIGEHIQIGRLVYTIIGVVAPWKEHGFFNEDINRSVIIPIEGLKLLQRDAKVTNAILSLHTDQDIDTTVEDIKHTLLLQAPKANLFIRSAKQIIVSMENQNQIFELLLIVIGGIALLVGGIGVMNVMLISVTDRKKEIGIRRALGAKRRQIQRLFLIESTLLSFMGGVLGILVGILVTWGVALYNDWPWLFCFMPIVLGFFVSVVSGIFFGFYPARRAAKLSPMASLRNET